MKTTEIQCLCGAVKVRLKGEPSIQFYCHCDDCQAVHGAAYVGVVLFLADAVEVIQGELETWTYKTTPRRCCAVCGTNMLAEVPALEIRGVIASLLPAGTFKPEFHEQCRYALRPVEDGLPHYAGFPPQFGGTDQRVDW